MKETSATRLAAPAIATLGQLRNTEHLHRTVKAEIRENLVAALRSGEPTFPGIVGFDDTVLPEVETSLLAGHDFVLLGERGQGKTRLMRTLVDLLDEWTPVVAGCEINDHPFAPACLRCRTLVAETTDDLPIGWLHRSSRYGEKLATPDTSVGDLIGDVDPTKVAEGRTLGAQVSLFDVSDPSRPRRLHQRTVGANSSSAVEYDHRAFLWWAPAKLAVLPVQTYSYPEAPFVGAVGLSVDRAAGIGEAGRASHEQGGYSAYITRAFVVRGRLFTLSAAGLEVNDLRTLAEQGRVAFPQPSGPPGG